MPGKLLTKQEAQIQVSSLKDVMLHTKPKLEMTHKLHIVFQHKEALKKTNMKLLNTCDNRMRIHQKQNNNYTPQSRCKS